VGCLSRGFDAWRRFLHSYLEGIPNIDGLRRQSISVRSIDAELIEQAIPKEKSQPLEVGFFRDRIGGQEE
jgi:hypothetical protein